MQHRGSLAHTPALLAAAAVAEQVADTPAEQLAVVGAGVEELAELAPQQLAGAGAAIAVERQRIEMLSVLQLAVPAKLEWMLPERWFSVEPQMLMSPEQHLPLVEFESLQQSAASMLEQPLERRTEYLMNLVR